MCRPTRQRYRGRLIRLGEMSDDDAQPLDLAKGFVKKQIEERTGITL
jgi:hypothetical protein